MGKRVLVVTGGESAIGASRFASSLPYDLVIAADSGLEVAQALGIPVDVVVGDLDSVSPETLERARAQGCEVESHPTEKDHTDFELALARGSSEGASEIVVIGGGGGRPDHWFSNLALLASTAQTGIKVAADMGRCRVSVAVTEHAYSEELEAGDLVSLLPVGGNARGVTTAGLSYPLRDEDLTAGSSRGVSNVALGGPARVEIRAGALLVMRPRRASEFTEDGMN